MIVEKKRNFIINFIYMLIIGLIGFFAVKYAVPILTPFLIGLLFAIIVRKIAAKPAARLEKVPNRLVHLVALLLFYVILVGVVVFAGAKIVGVAVTFFNRLPRIYIGEIQPAINTIINNLTGVFPELETFFQTSYQSINQTILNFVERISNTVLSGLTGFAGAITGILVKFVFTVISSFIFTLDLHRIEGFLKRQMGDRTLAIYENILYTTGHTAFRFIRAYVIIISVTFIELSIAFMLLGFGNPLILAIIIALFDALPVVGTGTIMIPWALYTLVVGDLGMALKLSITYLIITVVRQSIEPKVVGNQIGLHPILVIMGLYVGARLFGFAGMFLLPLIIVVLKKLNDDKLIQLWA